MTGFQWGLVLGTVAGVVAALVAEPVLYIFRRRALIKHLRADFQNAARHFSMVSNEFHLLAADAEWKKLSRIQWTTFASRGFFTHSREQLHLLTPKEAAVVFRQLVFIDNYDVACESYLKHHITGEPICENFIEELEDRSTRISNSCLDLSKKIKLFKSNV